MRKNLPTYYSIDKIIWFDYIIISIYSSLRSESKWKQWLCNILVRSVILYVCEKWSTSKKDGRKLAVLERKFPHRIFWSKKIILREYKIRSNNEIKEFLEEWVDSYKHKNEENKLAGTYCMEIKIININWDALNLNLNLGVDNPEEIVYNREEWRKLCGWWYDGP